jgi:hypothetical protein
MSAHHSPSAPGRPVSADVDDGGRLSESGRDSSSARPTAKELKPTRPAAAPQIEVFVRETIDSFPTGWILEPVAGETFDTAQTATRRLQAYAFSCGFAVVSFSGTNERKRYKCVHHAKLPRNTRNLEDTVTPRDVSKEAAPTATTDAADSSKKERRREGNFRGLGCKFEVFIAR